jgi:hypothetical protein
MPINPALRRQGQEDHDFDPRIHSKTLSQKKKEAFVEWNGMNEWINE